MYSEPIALAAVMPFLGGLVKFSITIIGVGFLIFVHELGHFLAAKFMGVRVERFSVGFGYRLIGFQRGETEYVLCAIPFGGYVRMAGEYPHQDRVGEDYEFYSKPPRKRAVIVIAGVCMNAIIAVITFTVAFRVGVLLTSPRIDPLGGGAAWAAGMEEGDEIIEIDGQKMLSFSDIAQAVALAKGEVSVRFKRGDEIITEKLIPEKSDEIGLYTIGVAPLGTLTVGDIGRILEEQTPPSIMKDDVILEAAGEKIVSINQFRDITAMHPGKPLDVMLLRQTKEGEQHLTVSVVPESMNFWELGCRNGSGLEAERVRKNGPAWKGGLRAGDAIITINGSPTEGFRSFQKDVSGSAGKEMVLGIKREEETVEVTVVPEYSPSVGGGAVEATFNVDTEPVVGFVEPGSPAEQLGLKEGDRVIATTQVNNSKSLEVIDWQDLERFVDASEGKPFTLTWERGEEMLSGTVTARRNETLTKGFLAIGFHSALTEINLGFVDSARFGVRDSYLWGRRIFETVSALIHRRVSTKAVSGPVGISVMGMHFVERGFGTFLYFLGILGINFAVINLLPIPVVDGGVLLFLGIEGVMGKPLPKRAQAVIQNIGAAALIAIFLLITIQDVSRYIIDPIIDLFRG